MTTVLQSAYDEELRKVAKRLGLPSRGDLEEAILRHCAAQVAKWIDAYGQPASLTDLLNLVATSLGVVFEEVHDSTEMDALLRRFPPQREPVMARLAHEFGNETDAVTVWRSNREPWEQPFLAVINCQDWHFHRRFFSKWHELAHRFVEGEQLRLAFRHTPVKDLRRDPEETLVDKIAATLAFYPPLFEPVFRDEFQRAGRVTFNIVDETRLRVAPDASRQATILACLKHCPHAVWFVRCGMGYKRAEERSMLSPQIGLLPDEAKPQPRLRVREASPSPAALRSGIRVHRNMQVPDTSVIARVDRSQWVATARGSEPLHAWQTSTSGPIGHGIMEVEAVAVDQEVWALMHMPKV